MSQSVPTSGPTTSPPSTPTGMTTPGVSIPKTSTTGGGGGIGGGGGGGGIGGQGGAGISYVTRTNNMASIQVLVRNFFRACGVNFPAPTFDPTLANGQGGGFAQQQAAFGQGAFGAQGARLEPEDGASVVGSSSGAPLHPTHTHTEKRGPTSDTSQCSHEASLRPTRVNLPSFG